MIHVEMDEILLTFFLNTLSHFHRINSWIRAKHMKSGIYVSLIYFHIKRVFHLIMCQMEIIAWNNKYVIALLVQFDTRMHIHYEQWDFRFRFIFSPD